MSDNSDDLLKQLSASVKDFSEAAKRGELKMPLPILKEFIPIDYEYLKIKAYREKRAFTVNHLLEKDYQHKLLLTSSTISSYLINTTFHSEDRVRVCRETYELLKEFTITDNLNAKGILAAAYHSLLDRFEEEAEMIRLYLNNELNGYCKISNHSGPFFVEITITKNKQHEEL